MPSPRTATVPAAPSEQPRPRRANPTRRNPAVHLAVLEATWQLLGEVGYHALTIEAVAARAEVGKATIYRWWRSRGALVGEAVATHLDLGPEPDTGNSIEDLCASIRATVDNYSNTAAGVVIPALASDLARDPELFDAFHESFLRPRREASGLLLQRAVDRGALPTDTDIPLLLDLWAGTVFYRVLVSREPITADLPRKLAELILFGTIPLTGDSRPKARARRARS